MKHMIGDRVEAAKIIFEDRDNFIPKLQEMAKKTNIKFVIIDRIEDGDEKDPGIS
jgi:hypothetical protein